MTRTNDLDERDDDTVTVEEQIGRGKDSVDSATPPLKEVNPTPIPDYNENAARRGESSRTGSPQKEAEDERRS